MAEVEMFCHRKLQHALTFTDAEIEEDLAAEAEDSISEFGGLGLEEVSYGYTSIFKNGSARLITVLIMFIWFLYCRRGALMGLTRSER
jgi:hypothetical protein